MKNVIPVPTFLVSSPKLASREREVEFVTELMRQRQRLSRVRLVPPLPKRKSVKRQPNEMHVQA